MAAFGVGAFAFGHLAAAVQDLIDQAVDGAAVGIDGEGVVALEALTAAVADGPKRQGILAGEVQLGGVLGQHDDGGAVGTQLLEDALGVDAQEGGVRDGGVIDESEYGAIILGGSELVRQGLVGVGEDLIGGAHEPPGASRVTQETVAKVAFAEGGDRVRSVKHPRPRQ